MSNDEVVPLHFLKCFDVRQKENASSLVNKRFIKVKKYIFIVSDVHPMLPYSGLKVAIGCQNRTQKNRPQQHRYYIIAL